jgi:hypothetical protein
MENQRTLTNATRADNGDTLPVPKESQYLVDFCLAAMKFLGPTNCPSMKKWILKTHTVILPILKYLLDHYSPA